MQQRRRKSMSSRHGRVSELLEQWHADVEDLERVRVDEEQFRVDVRERSGIWLARPREGPERYPNVG
jgi:hypothetical protein